MSIIIQYVIGIIAGSVSCDISLGTIEFCFVIISDDDDELKFVD
jgi:hypothetical protein